ncbi:glycoside hydrolase family 5 protein, partial [Bacteroidales bacterium OttesenSCG-928-M11]|nr:glycoside hydrolase family 5 protein [Bacteroidales bacterium OttesenSCG-928-M11]
MKLRFLFSSILLITNCLIVNIFAKTSEISQPDEMNEVTFSSTDIVHYLYTDNVTNLNLSNYSSWSGATMTEVEILGKKALQVQWTAPSGNSTGAAVLIPILGEELSSVFLSQYERIRFDIWTENEKSSNFMMFKLEGGSPSSPLTGQVNVSGSSTKKWITYDVPLSNFTLDSNKLPVNRLRLQSYSEDPEIFYIDNIILYTKDKTVPANEAITPPRLSSVWREDKVTSIFSNAYTDITTSFEFTPSKLDFNIDDNPNATTWRFGNTANVSIQSNINISGKNRFHIDVWTKEAKSFRIKLNGDDSYVYPQTSNPYTTPGDKWTSVDVELPEGLESITKIEIIGDESIYFLDNIYFYSDQVDGTQMYSSMWEANQALGRGINLGNAFEEQGYNPSGGNKFTIALAKDFIDAIDAINKVAESDNKFDHIRIPIRWDLWGKNDDGDDITGREGIYRTETTEPYTINPEFMADVKEVIDYSLDKNLKVLINIHHYNPFYDDYGSHEKRFFAMWEQIADQFKFYDHKLFFEILNEPRDPGTSVENPKPYRMKESDWYELITKTIPVIRERGGANTNRPLLIPPFDWGGFDYLERLTWPTGDLAKNLIATVHLYNPGYISNPGETGSQGVYTDIDWKDTQIERDLPRTLITVADRFQKKHPNVPIHVGEFGSTKKAETDSRSLWITYMRDLFEKQGYSWAYWEFRAGYGIASYSESSNTITYNKPIVDALLSNDVPKKPAAHKIESTEIIYELNDSKNGSAEWTNKDTGEGNVPTIIKKTFTPTGGFWGPGYPNNSKDSGYPDLRLIYSNGKSATCRITFKASSTKENISYLVSTNSSYYDTKGKAQSGGTSEFIFSPSTEYTEYSFIIDVLPNTPTGGKISFRLLSILQESVTLSIKDLLIEEVEILHEAAPVPNLSSEEVINIFSSKYGLTSPSFSGTGTQSYIKDSNNDDNRKIIQIADFEDQTITLSNPISIGDKKTLHLNVFAGSQMHGLRVKVNGEGGTVEESYKLPSHEWQYIGINLGSLTTISSIEFSGGTGDGRKLFLDHIYLQYGDVPENKEKFPAAQTPELEVGDVANFYSTKYGTDNSSLVFNPTKTTAIDTNDSEILQFNQLTKQTITYTGNLDLDTENYVHLDFYPEERFNLTIKLLYKNGDVELEKEIYSETTAPGKWTSLDVNIEEFVARTNGKITAIELISDKDSDSSYTLYLDHVYFYTIEEAPDKKIPIDPAYIPPVINKEGNLIPIFSDYYEVKISPSFSYRPSTITVKEDQIWRFKNVSEFSILFEGGLDITDMTHLHVDIWTKDAANFSLFLNDNQYTVSKSSVDDEWLRLDIPLSDLEDFASTTINEIGITGSEELNYYLDNLYFYNNEEPFETSDIADVNAGLGKGVNLGELLNKEDAVWSVKTIKSYVDEIAGAGDKNNKFGHIRLPIDWTLENRYTDSVFYNLNPGFLLDSIQVIVDYILDNNLKLVLTLPEKTTVSWQIADFFRYYPEALLFEIENSSTLSSIRESNSNRAVVTNQTSNFPDDNHLIAAIQYKRGNGLVWDDAQGDREQIISDLSEQVNGINLPIYVSQLGISSNTDMDSRALWITYVARYLEQEKYSWAYYNFTGNYGIYVNNKIESPVIDALLFNVMPDATIFGTESGVTIFDSVEDLTHSYPEGENHDPYTSMNGWITNDNNAFFCHDDGLTLYEGDDVLVSVFGSLTDDTSDDQLIKSQYLGNDMYFEKGVKYRLSFKVSASREGHTLSVNIGNPESGNVQGATYLFTPELSEQTISFEFTMEDSSEYCDLYFNLGIEGIEDSYPEFLFKDIIIEKVVSGILAAPKQPEELDVVSLFSTEYSGTTDINFPKEEQTTSIFSAHDGNGNSILFFSDFDYQSITFDKLTLTDMNTLHLSAYPGSVLHLTIEAVYESYSITKTITLTPHSWNELEINLTSLLNSSERKISEIKLSGGTGVGRKLYLDHIYFYNSLL